MAACKGENCKSIHIQNKKYGLCGDCMFKKTHDGKSKQEVYAERAKIKNNERRVDLSSFGGIYSGDEIKEVVKRIGKIASGEDLEFDINMQKQDAIKQNSEFGFEDEGERRFLEQLRKENQKKDNDLLGRRERVIDYFSKTPPVKTKKQKPIKQLSQAQSIIEAKYKATCMDMDYTEEPVCSGCNRYQGGDIKLSHSHLISRADCKRIGRPELIYDRLNLRYHCIDFGMNKGCHGKWEHPGERKTLLDYKKNIQYIKSVSPEMYLKYKVD